jgi:MscS family membrane protein
MTLYSRTLTPLFVGFMLVCFLAPAAHGADERHRPTDSCTSPRDSVLQLLFWLQPENQDPTRAATCLDTSNIDATGRPGDKILAARSLKLLLDVENLYVTPEDLPADPQHVDPVTGKSRHVVFPDRFPLFAVEKIDGRWLIDKEMVQNAPALYRDRVPLDLDGIVQSLPSWAQGNFAGLHIWQLLALLALLILGIILQKVLVFLLGSWLERLQVGWIREAMTAAHKPIGGLALALVLHLGLPAIRLPIGAHHLGLLSAHILAAFSVVWLGYRLVDVFADVLGRRAADTESRLDDQLVPLVRKSLKVGITIIGFIFILQNLNIDVGSLLAGLGIGGLAFALAAKDTVANLFGSVMIFIDRPFQVGDWIRMGDVEGTVEEVGFRTSRVRTFYNSVLTVPNARVTDSAVDNLGVRTFRRYKTVLSLTYSTPPAKIDAFCQGVRNLIDTIPGMRRDFYLVEFSEFGDSGLQILVYSFLYTKDWADELRARHNFNLAILRLAEDLGVEFAFPTQSIHVEAVAPASERAKGSLSSFEQQELDSVVESWGPRGDRYRQMGLTEAEDLGKTPKIG